MAPVTPPSKENRSASTKDGPAASTVEQASTTCTTDKYLGSQNENQKVNDPSSESKSSCEVKNGLKKAVLRRQASLSTGEKAFLHALLIDPVVAAQHEDGVPSDSNENSALLHREQMARAKAVLDDDVLFSLPFGGKGDDMDGGQVDNGVVARVQPPRTRRNQSHHIGLWRAHEEGIAPKEIRQLASQKSSSGIGGVIQAKKGEGKVGADSDDLILKRLKSRRSPKAASSKSQQRKARDEGEDGDDDDNKDEASASASSFGSIKSDEEVRRDKDDISSASSWGLSEGGFDHYDAWAVLKDEYADDFGFSYRDGVGENSLAAPAQADSDEESDNAHLFKILGTGADDVAAHPHVLSPPLMDSLLNFVPESLSDQNFWLRFSLVRDGASLEILKRYVRAAPNTILAIETTNGDVFGACCSSPWRQSPSYFGSGQAFLWKMRYNRMTPCHSLFEQAHLESEIDVFFYSGLNDYVQLCTADKIAVGGGELDMTGKEEHGNDVAAAPYVYLEEGEHYGFGIAIADDLLHGTSSPCATFRNPCLVNHSSRGEVFEIVNLEVWSFSPCDTVDAAERLEMTKFFVQESVLSSIASSLDSNTPGSFMSGIHSRGTSMFSGADLKQEEFYRRVGEENIDEIERMGFDYQNMLRPGGQNSMRSPHFASNGSSGPGDLGMHSPRMS